jgi:intracellular sulfur oxidation DsrE/DsrF family protein
MFATSVHLTTDAEILKRQRALSKFIVFLRRHRLSLQMFTKNREDKMTNSLTRVALALSLCLSASLAMAEGVMHRVAIHVNQNDPQVMNMALNNAVNTQNYYDSVGDDVIIEIVTYGPGLNMLVAGKSPVAQRIAALSLEMDNISFSACGNTHSAMSKKAGAEVVLLDEAKLVPSGVVRLIELQEQGFAYVRP